MKLSIEEIRYNLDHLKKQGAPDEALDEYLNQIGMMPLEEKKSSPLIEKAGLALNKMENVGSRVLDVGSQFSLGALETLDNLGSLLGVEIAERDFDVEPKGFLEKTARKIGEYAAPSPGGPATSILSSAVGKGASAVPQLSNIPSKSAIKATKLLDTFSELGGQTVGFIGEVLTSVPRQFYEKALQNPKLFKMGKITSDTYRSIGKKAQKALNYIVSEAGENVGKSVDDVLSKSNKTVNVEGFVNSIDDLVKKAQTGRVDPLTRVDMKKINKVTDELLELATDPKATKTTASLLELHGIKKIIDNEVSYDSQTVRKASPQGERILKLMREKIDSVLDKLEPKYDEANKAASKALRLKNRIMKNLKDETLSTSIKSIATNENRQFQRELLQEIDSLVPQNFKFFNDMENAVVKEAFDQIFPGRGGGSGSAQGMANFTRLLGAGAFAQLMNIPAIAALPITSPKTGGLITRGLAQKGKRRLIGKIAGVEAIKPRFEEE